mmetsp:Transcript_30263/g.48717  ORF Transcript_30263/g.48717 Transcript_30263/m.48717 type:complete len:212 (-) Transcript_30263:582-1217(-)
MQIEMGLGVDTKVLAEKRSKVQDPFVDLDHFVGWKWRRGAGRRSVLLDNLGGVHLIELSDDELDRGDAVEGAFGFICRESRCRCGQNEVSAPVEGFEHPVLGGVAHGERGGVRELALQGRHQILVRNHGGDNEGPDVVATHPLDSERRTPRHLFLALLVCTCALPLCHRQARLRSLSSRIHRRGFRLFCDSYGHRVGLHSHRLLRGLFRWR